MANDLNSLASTRHLNPEITEVVERFRDARIRTKICQDPADLTAYISAFGAAVRHQTLVALVAVDLELRYREAALGDPESLSELPKLESYLSSYPEFESEGVPIELIGDEYQVRKLYGDQPTRDEYRGRFPQFGERLDGVLDKIDHQLIERGPFCLDDTADIDATTDGIAETEGGVATDLVEETVATPADLRVKNHFVFKEKLGEGGMGAVFSAVDQLLGRVVAIKVIRGRFCGDQSVLTQFFREAQLASRLQHPGICPIYEVGLILSPDASSSDPIPFIAMKRVEGQTLAEALRSNSDESNRDKRRAMRGRWLEVFGEVADAVGYAHQREIIHRDLKPSNIMLGAHRETQVMDWGLAKLSLQNLDDRDADSHADSSATQFGTVKGTWAYMPPEQATGRTNQIDARADVFALGSILCEILTGGPAYLGRANELIDAARRGDLRDARERLARSGADEELIQLTLRCLEPRREDRPVDAREVACAIADYRAGVERRLQKAEVEAEKERGERIASAERLRASRWRVRLAAAILTFVALSAAVSWLYVQSAVTTAAGQQTYASQLDLQANSLLDAAVAEPWNDVAWDRYVENRRFSANARKDAERQLGVLLSIPGVAAMTGNNKTQTQAMQSERELVTARRDRDFCLAIREARIAGMTVREEVFDFTRELAAYQKAIASYGVRLQNPPDAAKTINGSAIRDELLGVLDELLQYSVILSEVDFQLRSEDLQRLLQVVDPTPIRQELRTLVCNASYGPNSREKVTSLVERWDFEEHPLATSLVLCNVLGRLDPLLAIDSLTRISEQDPRRFETHNALGYRYLVLNPPDRTAALGHLQAAAVLTPGSPGVNLNLGNLLSDLGRYREAEACYRRAIELQPDYASAYQNLAVALHEMGRFDEAVENYRKVISIREDPLAYSSLGKTFKSQDRIEEAEASWRKAIELAPSYAPLYHDLAMLLEQQRRLDEAEAAFRKSIATFETDNVAQGLASSIGLLSTDKIDPVRGESAAKHDFGIMLMRQKRFAEAESFFRKAIDLRPEFPEAHRSLGDLLLSRRRIEEAEACYRESMRLKADPATYVNLAKLLADSKQFNEAETLFRKAIVEFPNVELPQAHLGLGAVLYYGGRLKDAETSLRTALRMSPDARAASNLGGILVANEKYAEGEKFLKRAIEIDPKFASPYLNLTVLLRRQNRLNDAESLLRSGLRHLDSMGEIHCQLGRILWQQGRFTEAIETLERGHELGSKQAGWSLPSKQWLEAAKRDLGTRTTLEGILRGNAAPEDADELIALASLCQQPHQKRYSQSVEFYQQAFTLKPGLANVTPQSQHRYNSACAAALASSGSGINASGFDSKSRVKLRVLAREWLDADLQQWRKLAELPAARIAVVRALRHWLEDPDLASVRDTVELEALPNEEREQWASLWSIVRNTLSEGAKPAEAADDATGTAG